MSVYIQEVLGLLKRNKKKRKLDKVKDHFEFGKLYRTSALNTGAAYNPKMEPFVVNFGDLVCEITEDLTRTQPGSGGLGFIPVYTTPEGSCAWDTLKDSIITQNAIGDTITINNGNLIVEGDLQVDQNANVDLQLTAGSANILDLTEDRVVIVGPNGELEDDANFTMDGTTFTANVNVIHGTDVPAGVPTHTTTINSNLKLEGPVYDSLGNLGGLNKVLVGLADGRVKWQDDDVVEALTYGALWQGDPTNYKVELLIGTADQILISDGTTFAWQDNPAAIVGEVCDVYRIPLWTPDAQTLGCSLLIQDGNSGTPATKITNDGKLQQTKELYLDTVAQDDTLTEVLVRDTGSSNEVKFRDVSTIVPPTGFDTLTMSETAGWQSTEGYMNAYIGLDDTAVAGESYMSIKDMSWLTDGDRVLVIAKNAKTGALLPENVIRFPNWSLGGDTVKNYASWIGGPDLGYPTASLLYGESLKFKAELYDIPGGTDKELHWDACCKIYSSNVCPVAASANYVLDEDTTYSGSVSASDDGYGGYGLTYTVVTNPGNGTIVLQADGTFLYTPTANFNGTDSLQYKVNDGYCDSNVGTISFQVAAVADPPIWTSTDPVTANTYPNLTGGDTWTYNWTTNDPDHPCSALVYTTPSLPSWLTFTDNGDCTGTLSGTFPTNGGNFPVTLTVTDPDGNADTQTFTIGGLGVTKDTYFVFWSDVSGSMNTTITQTAQMVSVPEVRIQAGAQGSNPNLLTVVGGNSAGKVDETNGDTSSAFLCVTVGMEVTGTGIPAGTTVVAGGGMTIQLSNSHTASSGDIITFTTTQAQKDTDYADTNNLRNLLQDFYATGGTKGSGNADPATNGQDMYDSHLYWNHMGPERQIQYFANGGAGDTIGAGGYFPNAANIFILGFADESSNYPLWNNRNSGTDQNILDDVALVKSFVTTLETAAGNNQILRGSFMSVNGGAGSGTDIHQFLGPDGFCATGGRTLNGFIYPPEATAYNQTTQTLFPESTGSPTRFRYRGNVTDGGGSTYYYNEIRQALLDHGVTGI